MHTKNAKNAMHVTRKDGIFLSWHVLRFSPFFMCVHCLLWFLICVANPASIAYDRLETGLYTAALQDHYCGREGTSMLISATQVKCLD